MGVCWIIAASVFLLLAQPSRRKFLKIASSLSRLLRLAWLACTVGFSQLYAQAPSSAEQSELLAKIGRSTEAYVATHGIRCVEDPFLGRPMGGLVSLVIDFDGASQNKLPGEQVEVDARAMVLGLFSTPSAHFWAWDRWAMLQHRKASVFQFRQESVGGPANSGQVFADPETGSPLRIVIYAGDLPRLVPVRCHAE